MKRPACGTLVSRSMLLLLGGAAAEAASWSPAGTSGFSIPSMNWARDYERLLFHSITEDGQGNLYATANTANDGSLAGGVTIYAFTGPGAYVKLRDVDVNATAWPGRINKLMTRRQDGLVYALQNYSEAGWGYPGTQNCRLLRIGFDGQVELVADLTAAEPSYSPARSWVEDAEMGPDGNIYFCRNGADDYFKRHFFYRWNFATSAIEEAPRDPIHYEEDFDGTGQTHRMFALAYAGTARQVDSYACLKLGPTARANPWAIGFGPINTDPVNNKYHSRAAAAGDSAAGWGRDRVTALAYDGNRRTLWMGVRGAASLYGRWQAYRQQPDGNPQSGQGWGDLTVNPVDTAGVQNPGAVRYDKSPGLVRWYAPSDYLNGAQYVQGLTLAARLKLLAGWTADSYVVALAPSPWSASQGGDTNPLVGVRVSGGQWVLCDIKAGGAVLATLGPFVPEQWVEIRLYASGFQQQDQIKCWFNGAQVYSGGPSGLQLLPACDPVCAVGLGAGWAILNQQGGPNGMPIPPMAGGGTMVLDWLAYYRGLYTGDAGAWAALPPSPGADPVGMPVGGFQPGHVLPHYWLNTAIMSCWKGESFEPSLYTGVGLAGTNPDPMPGVTAVAAWHCNNNNPTVSNRSTGAPYWVQALAVNPCDGSAWMSWGAYLVDATHGDGSRLAWGYYYDDTVGAYSRLGRVYRVGWSGSAVDGDEGPMPGAGSGSIVAALAFVDRSATVAALAIDSVDGAYRLFTAPNPTLILCCPDPFADADQDQDVDMADYAAWQRCQTRDLFQYPIDEDCTCFDRNSDGVINDDDLIRFIDCAVGPAVPADKGCDGP